MASPQLEHGYTRISNEILEALRRTQLSGYETRIIFHILRLTYGYREKKKRISAANFARATGINRRHCQNTLRRLVRRKIISAEISADYGPGSATTYQFNKDYEEWREDKKIAPKSAPPYVKNEISAEIGAERAPKSAPIISAEIRAPLKKIKEKKKESENPPGPMAGQGNFLNRENGPTKEDFKAAKQAIRKRSKA